MGISDSAMGEAMCILVVDPASVFLRCVELAAGRYGYDVQGAGTARAALEARSGEPFNLVIAQENLPDMEWSDFCRKVGTDSASPGVPVVVLSPVPGSSDGQGRQGGTVAPVRARLISMKELVSVIQEHLPYKNERRQIRAPLAMKAMIREENRFVPCQGLNLSAGGALIMRKDPLPRDSEIHLLLTLEKMGSPLQISGKVVYAAEKARGRHPRGMGIQFNNVETATGGKLHQFLEDYVASSMGR